MPQDLMTGTKAAKIIQAADQVDRAKIFQGTTDVPFVAYSMTLALDNAQDIGNPLPIRFPFKAVAVRSATDSTVSINLRPNTVDSFQSDISLKQNDALNFDDPVAAAFLSWTAQAGKTITLLFLTQGKFTSGSLINTIQGGVTVQSGQAVAAIASTNLSAATAAIIAPALSTRKTCTLINLTGADLFIGGDNTVTDDGSGATATTGIKLAANDTFVWQNTAALYGYSVPGGRVNRLEES